MKEYKGTFNEAFAQAMKELGKGQQFIWNGKTYTTTLAGEALAAKELAGKGITQTTTPLATVGLKSITSNPTAGLAKQSEYYDPNSYKATDFKGLDNANKLADFKDNALGAVGEFGQYLPDVFKFALGLHGANEKLPEFKTPQYFTDYEQRMKDLSMQGLTEAERGQAINNAERGYAYDVNNIERFSGGRPGTALANLGRAGSTLQGALGNINVADAQMQRNNLLNYGNVVNQHLGLDQNEFNRKYDYATQNKLAGAQLASDALANIQSRQDYNKAYGEGSAYDKYMNGLLQGNDYLNSIYQYQLQNPLDLNNLNFTNPTINPNAELNNYQNQYYLYEQPK